MITSKMRWLVVLIAALATAGPVLAAPTVVFLSDFGTVDDSVAICKGVMIGIEPELRIIDITHQVTPFSIPDASRFLAGTSPYYPAGIVFLVVVDPGVGSSRRPMVVKSRKGQFFVLPDNGIISPILERDGIEGAREITNPDWMLGKALSSTFHGRDIFAPVAARLARGDDWTRVGPEIPNPVKIPPSNASMQANGIQGEIIAVDGPYGNLITNITAEDFEQLHYENGWKVRTRIGELEMTLPFVKTFSDVPLHAPLLYIDSRGRVGLAVNQGSFAESFHIRPPLPIFVERPSPQESK
jgi:hypothetical protein